MTKTEFVGQFERLCKGFKHDATAEQTEAWYRRLSHWEAADWAEAVTTLLCAPKFPYLDAVLEALDEAQRARKTRQLHCERKQAERVYAEIQAAEGGPLSPALFQAVRAFSGRAQVQQQIALIEGRPEYRDWSEERRERELERLRATEARLTRDYTALLTQLDEADLAAFVARYGQAVAA